MDYRSSMAAVSLIDRGSILVPARWSVPGRTVLLVEFCSVSSSARVEFCSCRVLLVSSSARVEFCSCRVLLVSSSARLSSLLV